MNQKLINKSLLIFICVLLCGTMSSQTLPGTWSASWMGSTYGYAADYPGSIHVQNYIEQMYVGKDGRSYTNAQWDEGGRNGGVYNADGTIEKLVKHPSDGSGGSIHGVGVTANDNWAFWNDGSITRKYYLNRWSDNENTWTTVTYGTGESKFLAADNTYLFASGGGIVQVWNIDGGNKVRDISIANCSKIAADRSGNFWVIVGTEAQQWSNGGNKLKTITGLQKPKAIAVGHQNSNLVYIGDNGPRQILVFDATGSLSNPVQRIGTLNGIGAGTPGLVEYEYLKFWDINGLGTDQSGNVYVGLCGGGNWDGFTLRKFNPSLQCQFSISDFCFVDNADFEPGTDGTSIWGAEEHFVYDYSRPTTTNVIPENNHWWLKGYTINTNDNPSDPRLHPQNATTSVMCRKPSVMGGTILLYMTGQYSGNGSVFKVVGENAVHVTTLPIHTGNTLWVDTQGNVWYADGAKIYYMPLTGKDGSGNPVFGSRQEISYSGALYQIRRLVYLKESDVMMLSGFSNANPVSGTVDISLAGNTLVKITNWSSTRSEQPWIDMPYDNSSASIPDRIMPKEIAVCDGNYAFVIYVYNGGNSNPDPPVKVFDLNSRSYIGEMYPNSSVGLSGWVDMVGAIKVTKRSNGEYVCLVEEDYQGKLLVYRWCPSGNCSESTVAVASVSVSPTSASVAVNATTQLTETVAPNNATNKSVTWSSSNTTVATVSTTGLVTGRAAGSATITVTTVDGAKTTTCGVTVTSAGAIVSVNDHTTGAANNQFEFVGTWTAENQTGNYNNDGTWDYGNNTTGYYRVRFVGTQVKVYSKTDINQSIVKMSIDGGAETDVDTYSPSVQYQALIWTSPVLTAGQHTLKVRNSGVKNGSSSNYFTYADRVDIISGTSTIAVTGVTMSPTTASIAVNATTQLTATVAPSNANNKNVTWSTSNSTIATVSSTGLVIGKAAGTATITVTTVDGAKTATCAVTVTSAGGSGTVVNNGIYELEPQNATGKRLDVSGGGTTDRTNVQIWTSASNNSQRWKFINISSGIYELEPQCAVGKRLSVSGSGSADGTNVLTWTANSGNSQRWKLTNISDDIYELEPQCATGKRLDVSGYGTIDGTNVHIWTSSSNNNQRWKLILSGGSWTTIENTNAGWAWSGFTLDACSSCSGGSSHSTSVVNSSGTISFTGTDVELYCENWVGAGSVEVLIDNVSKGTFVQSGLAKFATIGGLSNAQHTLKIVAKDANWPSLDYIRFAVNPAKSAVIKDGRIGAEGASGASSVLIYPNPVSSVLHVSNTEANAEIAIFTMDGKLVYKLVAVNTDNTIDVSNFNKCLYILSVRSANNSVLSKLVVK